MKNPEALKFLISRLTVLDRAVSAMEENKTFSSLGDWESHSTIQAMRTQIPVWLKSLEKTLGTKTSYAEYAYSKEDKPEKDTVLDQIEKTARVATDYAVGEMEQIIDRFRKALIEIEDKAREAIIERRK